MHSLRANQKQARKDIMSVKQKQNLCCNQYSVFKMNGNDIEVVNSYKHLGLTRKAKFNDNSELITERIQLARSTAYALMGAGLHGLNGVNPEVSVSLWNLYIQPRLLYGLESIQFSRADISKLEKYQRDFLRQIQHLPERVGLQHVLSTFCLVFYPLKRRYINPYLPYSVTSYARIV